MIWLEWILFWVTKPSATDKAGASATFFMIASKNELLNEIRMEAKIVHKQEYSWNDNLQVRDVYKVLQVD